MNENEAVILSGKVISPGIVIGTACHYQAGSVEQTAFYRIGDHQVEEEIRRFNNAINKSISELNELILNVKKNIGKNEAKIFEVHITILEDKNIINKIYSQIKNKKINVEYSVKTIFEEFEDIFAKMDNEYLKDRGTDFSEIKRRLLSHLTGEKGRFLCNDDCFVKGGAGRIILTRELTPSMISLLKGNDIRGFITKSGGENSHAAILVRALKIPYITGIETIDKIKCSTMSIIDSENKSVIFNPDNATLGKYKKVIDEIKTKQEFEKNQGPVVCMGNNVEIEIHANIITLNDLKFFNEYNLAGIGLIRTEFLFYDDIKFPSLEEQARVYSELITESNGKPITFRLFDVGGDKKIRSINFSNEENPLLGLRGIRYLLKNKKMLTEQIEAISKASLNHSNVKILYPMISDIAELEEVKGITREILKKYDMADKIKIGMMFEVPSVFISPNQFLDLIDFASIGSNDLAQYLFGIDRNNPYVNDLYKVDSPVIYELIRKLLAEAEKRGKGVTLCGEINLETEFIEEIIKIGIRKISVSPLSAPMLIRRVKSIKVE